MKKIKIFSIVISIVASYSLSAQLAITTDGSSPDASAMLDVKSTDKGILVPRMTQSQIETIVSPADGLLVFNTDDDRFYFYNDGAGEWKEIAIGAGTITPIPPTWSCGDALFDTRDSKSYATVQIGNQCWMAESLNVGTRIDGLNNQTDNGTIEKYCYDDNISNCDIYGGLYQWNEMMQYVTTEGTQGICPAGWHLPSDAEWTTLTDQLGGTGIAGGKLKEAGTTHWWSPNTGAINSSGFTALPGGYRSHSGLSFGGLGSDGGCWSSTEDSGLVAWARSLQFYDDQVQRSHPNKAYGFSVRCLKN